MHGDELYRIDTGGIVRICGVMKTMSRIAVTVIATAVITISPEARQALSIDTLMATPFPTDLVAAPTGGAIAWVSSNSGVHNILTAAAPDHKWRAVTSYTGDDGLWITEVGFTADAKTIVYVRGDGANRQGESPNPAQLQDGTEQAVFAVPVAGGAPKRLGPGNGPVPSPRGQRVAWVSLGQIWSADLATTEAPARLVNARGSASGLSWSPDGSMLAFTSGRGTHS
jgi:Tol biopolymer transport system component